jgi:hypothetical protein
MKRILNHLLTDILLILVVILTIIILGRNLLAGENVYSIIKDNISDKISTDNIEEGVLKDFINEEDAEGISEYLNEIDFDDEMGNLISSYFKYTSGITEEKPDLTNFEKIIKEAISNYEKETGKKVDEKKVDKALDTMDKVLEETTPTKLDKRIKLFLSIIYSDSLLIITIVSIMAVLGLLFIINRNLFNVIKSSAIVTSINTIFLFIMSFLINMIKLEGVMSNKAIKYFVKLSRKIALVFLLISVLLIIILIINKSLIKKDSFKNKKYLKEEKKEEIEE